MVQKFNAGGTRTIRCGFHSFFIALVAESWDVYISDSVTAATRGKVFIYNSNFEVEGYLSFVWFLLNKV